MKNDVLKPLRDKIDNLDDQIFDLMQERAKVALEIGQVKKHHSIPIMDIDREKNLLDRLMNKAQGRPLSPDAIHNVYNEIVKACRSAQAPIRVSFLGPLGTFSHAAALHQFGKLAHYVPCDDFEKAFKEVESNSADYVIVPFENSTEGIVGQTLDILANTKLKARSMLNLRISLSLMNNTGDMSKVKKIASHPQALAQSRTWLLLNFPSVELIPTGSTAAAASMAVKDESVAVIGHPALAGYYKLKSVAENIEDSNQNQTCFLIMGHEDTPATGDDRTLVCFTTKHKSGSLYSCLQPLADLDVNMTRLHSRPSPSGVWEYMFFLELEGHASDEKIKKALTELKKFSEKCFIIGSYKTPETTTPGTAKTIPLNY